jgi:hypothetical protein
MKQFKSFLPLFILASLWGFGEMLRPPHGVISALGVLFLVLNRRIASYPWGGTAMGLIVCFYKTYSDNFFVCQWLGVMSLAISFDIFARIMWDEGKKRYLASSMIGALTNILAMALFTSTVIFLAREPHWVAGGWDRVMSYFMKDVLPATVLSLGFAPLAMYLGEKWTERQDVLTGKFAYGMSLGLMLIAWIMASLHRFG